MRVWFIVIALLIIGFFGFSPEAGVVYANNMCPKNFTNLCGDSMGEKIRNLNWVGNIVQVLFVFAIIISLFFLIWGGIKWIMSNGDKGKVTSARDTIIGAIVGLIIALLAYFILDLVVTIITGEHLQNLELPKDIFTES